MTTVTGKGFAPSIKVLLADKCDKFPPSLSRSYSHYGVARIACEVRRVSEGKLLLRLPPLAAAGMMPLTLINSPDYQLRWEGVIYTDEPFSFASENLIREDDEQPTIAFTTSTLLREMKLQEQALLQEDLRRQEELAKKDRERRRAEVQLVFVIISSL